MLQGRFTRQRKQRLQAAALAVLASTALLSSSSCTSLDSSSTPDEFMRFTNWWNFYERGRERLQDNYFEKAAEDFERCIGLRKGARFAYPKPSWRVRTYGLHFQENYFPNRELGICYYLLNRHQEAVDYLSRSLDQLPSSRAKYYYNKALSASIQTTSTQPPTVSFDHKDPELWVRHRSYTLAGQASGAGHISHLKIGDRAQWIERAEKTQPFSQDIALHPGTNWVTVTAKDLLGRETAATVILHADWIPPGLFIQTQHLDQGSLVIKAVCRDNDLIETVQLDGKPIGLGSPPAPAIPLSLRILENSAGQLRVMDRAGNVLDIDLWEEFRSAQAQLRQAVQYADASAGILDTGSPAAPSPPADEDPVIDLKTLPSEVTVYQPFLYIDASLTAARGIQSILINDKPWKPFQVRNSTSAHFQHLLDLPLATNTFSLGVIDQSGTQTRREVTIYKKEPEFLWASHRMRASVVPVITPDRDWAGEYLRLMMETLLQDQPSGQPARFFLLPTDREVWEELLTQQKLSLSDLADDRILTRIQTASPAELLLKPHLYPDRGGMTIRSKVVRNDSGEVLFAEDVYSETTDGDLDQMMKGLVSKVERRFPLARGIITSVKKKKAEILFENPQALFPGFRFLIIHPKGSSLEAGTLRKSNAEALQLVVTTSRSTDCSGKFLQEQGTISVQPGDYVFAK